jgi:phosphate transport system substrate-binding protein
VGGSKPPGRATPPGEPTVNTSPVPTQNATPAPIVCAQGALSFDGSPNLEPFLQQVNSDFQAVCPGISLSLRGDGSRAALNFLEQGRIDVAVTDLTARPSRKVVDHTLAVLLYALVVSPDVQVGNLSSAQLQQIYQGQITNWAQVGGPDEPITVVLRPPNDAISAIFQAFVLGGATVHVKGIHLKKDGPSVVVQAVSHLAGAISYVPYGVIQGNNVGVVSIDGVSPSTQSIQQGSYPFWSVEHLYTQGDNTALLQPYLQFFNTTGELAQMDQFGIVPLSLLLPSSISSHLPGPVV